VLENLSEQVFEASLITGKVGCWLSLILVHSSSSVLSSIEPNLRLFDDGAGSFNSHVDVTNNDLFPNLGEGGCEVLCVYDTESTEKVAVVFGTWHANNALRRGCT